MLIEIFNFAFGPYPQKLNIYLAEKQPTGVALTLYDAPHEAAGSKHPISHAVSARADEDQSVYGD